MNVVMEIILSEKNKKNLVFNGFKYGFQKELSGNIQRWICTKKKLKSFLKINNLNNIEQSNLEHTKIVKKYYTG